MSVEGSILWVSVPVVPISPNIPHIGQTSVLSHPEMHSLLPLFFHRSAGMLSHDSAMLKAAARMFCLRHHRS